jgi:formylglycine-generating enzyme required for sulfatase activity
VHPKVSSLVAMIHGSPKLVGTLKAWRAPGGLGVEDEMRIVDASGNPISLNHASRVFAQADARWRIIGVDTLRGRKSEASGQWQNGEMRLDAHALLRHHRRFVPHAAGSFERQWPDLGRGRADDRGETHRSDGDAVIGPMSPDR